jgi:hypothetical protein
LPKTAVDIEGAVTVSSDHQRACAATLGCAEQAGGVFRGLRQGAGALPSDGQRQYAKLA